MKQRKKKKWDGKLCLKLQNVLCKEKQPLGVLSKETVEMFVDIHQHTVQD